MTGQPNPFMPTGRTNIFLAEMIGSASQRSVTEPRCRMAYRAGSIVSRCALGVGHGVIDSHRAWGLAEFPYQIYSWYPGSGAEFSTDRTDIHAWAELAP